jgi:hypothetical protein
MNKQPQWTEFKVNAKEYAFSWGSRNVNIELGEHPIAQELGDLLISKRALIYSYLPKLQAILYGAEKLSATLIMDVLKSISKSELKALVEKGDK